MAFCINCGQALTDKARFCSNCGKPVEPNGNPNSRETLFAGKIYKCPVCGETLKTFETTCPSCSHEIRGTSASKVIEELSKKLEKATNDEQKITIIKTFPIPNNKDDIVEFMALATSNFDTSYYISHLTESHLSDAWLAKLHPPTKINHIKRKSVAYLK